MARHKEYTPAAFGRAVDRYFAGISRRVAVQEYVPTGRYTQKGMPILEPRDVKNDAGEVVMQREYLLPPSVGDLCLHLGISRATWARYAATDGYREVCDEAKLRVEAYLEQKLLTGDPKAQKGIIFNLQANFDWRERKELELGAETREMLSMDEKIALLREVASDFSGGDNG